MVAQAQALSKCSVSCVGTADRTQSLLSFSLGTSEMRALSQRGSCGWVRFVERAVSRVAKRECDAREEVYSAEMIEACRRGIKGGVYG